SRSRSPRSRPERSFRVTARATCATTDPSAPRGPGPAAVPRTRPRVDRSHERGSLRRSAARAAARLPAHMVARQSPGLAGHRAAAAGLVRGLRPGTGTGAGRPARGCRRRGPVGRRILPGAAGAAVHRGVERAPLLGGDHGLRRDRQQSRYAATRSDTSAQRRLSYGPSHVAGSAVSPTRVAPPAAHARRLRIRGPAVLAFRGVRDARPGGCTPDMNPGPRTEAGEELPMEREFTIADGIAEAFPD